MAETTEEGWDIAADMNRNQMAERIADMVRISWIQD